MFEKMRFLFLLFLPFFLPAQKSDILLLRKNNKTIRQFFAGTVIEFFTTEHMYVSGNIDSIRRDSLFMTQSDVRMVPNWLGTYSADTLGKYDLRFSIHNIGSFPANRKRSGLISNGTLFMIGGSAYLALNIINTLAQGEDLFAEDNVGKLAAGAAVLGTGVLLHFLTRGSDEFRLGKKYTLKYLPVEVKP